MEISSFCGDRFLKTEFEKLIKKFKIKNIVETGTFLGETTKDFSEMVENVYTIEINNEFYEKSKKKLANFSNTRLFLGNSPEIFRDLLPKLKGRTLFFLDAHWNNYWPIIDELKEISNNPHLKESIIVIHDFYVPGKNFGFDAYHNAKSKTELFAKRILFLLGKALKLNLIEKQKLDYSFIEEQLIRINPNYKHYYNSKVEGAKRGVIFIYP